jgi:hypothetical protein
MFPIDRLRLRGEIRSEEIISKGWAEVIELEGMVGENGEPGDLFSSPGSRILTLVLRPYFG